MYCLLGAEANVETILLLLAAKGYGPLDCSTTVKRHYRELLAQLQPHVPRQNELFVRNVAQVSDYIAAFEADGGLTDIPAELLATTATAMQQKIHAAEMVIAKVDKTMPNWAALLRLAVNTIFCAASGTAGGGTTSNAVGVIWLDNRPAWCEQDLIEFFGHELTHTLLFLDEYRYSHFPNLIALADPKHYTLSAILKRERPLDKVVHSIVVATEVLLLRERYLGHPTAPKLHPPTEQLLAQTWRAIAAFEGNDNIRSLCTPRVEELIARCEEALGVLGNRAGCFAGAGSARSFHHAHAF